MIGQDCAVMGDWCDPGRECEKKSGRWLGAGDLYTVTNLTRSPSRLLESDWSATQRHRPTHKRWRLAAQHGNEILLCTVYRARCTVQGVLFTWENPDASAVLPESTSMHRTTPRWSRTGPEELLDGKAESMIPHRTGHLTLARGQLACPHAQSSSASGANLLAVEAR